MRWVGPGPWLCVAGVENRSQIATSSGIAKFSTLGGAEEGDLGVKRNAETGMILRLETAPTAMGPMRLGGGVCGGRIETTKPTKFHEKVKSGSLGGGFVGPDSFVQFSCLSWFLGWKS